MQKSFKDSKCNQDNQNHRQNLMGVTFGNNKSSENAFANTLAYSEPSAIDHQALLPVNLLHSPAQYNKMLIKSKPIQISKNKDIQLGMVKNLQFLNDEYFKKQAEKKEKRMQEYILRQKQQKKKKIQCQNFQITKCHCCCCNNYCSDCAKLSICDQKTSRGANQNSVDMQDLKKSYLIDIQAMKKGYTFRKKYNKKMMKQDIYSGKTALKCHEKLTKSAFRIEELINQTLIKTIDDQKIKQLQNFKKAEKIREIQQFNEYVRQNNRCQSAPKNFESKNMVSKIDKKQLRIRYHESVKDLILQELRKDKSKPKTEIKAQIIKCHSMASKLNMEEVEKLRLKYGKKALQEQRKLAKISLQERQKKAQNLSKLLHQQSEIMKKCHYSKFKPSKKEIQQAFSDLI